MQADKILINEAPLIPFAYPRWHLLVKSWVTRFPIALVGHNWKDVVIEPH